MIAYHGTTKEKAESIIKEGFSVEKQGENGSHFGNGVYLATTKKRAKAYGKQVVAVEIDESGLAPISSGWLKEYQSNCEEVYRDGTPADKVNTVVGEMYKEVYSSKGHTGIIMDTIMGRAKEMVIYDISVIQSIRI